jgi:hypothetical protein
MFKMRDVIRSSTVLLIGAGLIGAVPLSAQTQSAPATQAVTATSPGQAAAAATTTMTAKVTAVDSAKRTVTLQGPKGKTRTIEVGDQVRNFDQIKVGDTVHVKYTQALALELKKGAASMGEPTAEAAMTPPPAAGAKPGGTVAQKVTAMTQVTAIDPAKHLVTLRGPKGNEVDVDVEDPEQLKNIKVGDHVQVTYVEALAISVKETPPPAK